MAWFTETIAKYFVKEAHTRIPVLEKADGTGLNAQAGANNGLLVEGVAGGVPIPVTGSFTATTDLSSVSSDAGTAKPDASLAAGIVVGSNLEQATGIQHTNGFSQHVDVTSAGLGAAAYSTARGHGTATYASDTTFSLTPAAGLSVTDAQLRRVIAISSTGNACAVYENGRNRVALHIATGTVTIAGAGAAPLQSGNVIVCEWDGPVAGVSTAGADARSNTRDATMVEAFLNAFNGTTADRIKAGITTATVTLTGFLNTLPWAVYHSTPETRTNGMGGPLEADTVGRLRTAGAQYNSTAPSMTSPYPAPLEVTKAGALHIAADIYDHLHQTHLAVAGAYTGAALAFPCDGVRTDLDNSVIYYQPKGRPWQCVDGNTFADPTKWTITDSEWTIAGGKATHVAEAGHTTALVGTIDSSRPLIVNKRYAVKIKVSGCTAGGVTPFLGTQTGTQRTANGTYVEVITVATSSGISVVPTADFDGSVEILQIYGRSPKLTAKTYEGYAAVEIVGIAAGGALSTLVAASDTVEVHALYRRVPGVADLG